jgi:outer membrane protein assembly factor BamC
MRAIHTALVMVAATALFALGGCKSTLFGSNKVDYKSAGKTKPLEVPPDLTQPNVDERYVVPDLNPGGTATYSEYARDRASPQQASVQANPDGVLPAGDGSARIERSGTQRWIVARGDPAQLWPVVKDFWQENGFIIAQDNPAAGTMETDWAENRAKIPQDGVRSVLGKFIDGLYSTPERDKFRTRIEKGQEPGTTEIYISHRGMYEVFIEEGKERTMWQPRPADPDLEAEMLRRLMVKLGVKEARAKTDVAAAPVVERAKLVRSRDGGTQLELDDDLDRAWRRVGLALDRVGFTVEDRDRSQGMYFVRYVDAKEDAKSGSTGLLSKLKFWGSDDNKVANAAQYRIEVAADANGTIVTVLNKDGRVDRSDTAGKIVALLYDQLK